MTTMSIEARSNSSARARSLSLGRSLKENSIVLRIAASFGLAFADRPHDVLGRLRLEGVDDAGDARAALDARRSGRAAFSMSPQGVLDQLGGARR